MKDLVIIGNGFDLFCGLKSKYSDFFKYKYKNFDKNKYENDFSILKNKKSKINDLDKNKKGRLEELSHLNKSYQESTTPIFIQVGNLSVAIESREQELDLIHKELTQLKKDRLELVDSFFNNNQFTFWDYLFMYKSEEDNEKFLLWSDVESEILDKLTKIEQDYTKDDLLEHYINSKKHRKNNDFISLSEFLLINDYNIFDFLLEELNQFEKSFKNYLIEQINDNKQRYQSKAHELFKKIVGINENNEYYVINFNYTIPYTNLNKRKIYFMNNVHGDLSTDEVIFGIDGFSQSSINLNFFTKTSRIMSLDKKEREPIPIKEEVENIYFFGHSLSSADYSYFLSIFDFYDIYNSNIKLNFVYSNHEDNAKKNMLKKISTLLTNYGEGFDNKAKGKNLMHKLNLENRLLIKEI